MSDVTYPLFPIVSALGFVVVLTPLPWHLEAWNSGTCYYMIWTALACLNQFINSVVWANDAINRAPIWCDICDNPFNINPVELGLILFLLFSYPDYSRSFRRDSGFLSVHHAKIVQHFQGQGGRYHACRGAFSSDFSFLIRLINAPPRKIGLY